MKDTSTENEQAECLAARHGIAPEVARALIEKHGSDDGGVEEAIRNVVHFLKAPS